MADIERLQNIKDIIEQFNKQQQIEVLRILFKNSATMSENNNGSFINLTEVSSSTLVELEEYMAFVNTQQNQLLFMEQEKDSIKKEFFDDTCKRKTKAKASINMVIHP
jgi:wyosine [tRNA(Phe)-imidazoG37] synthetase (radical SAM superfamily)